MELWRQKIYGGNVFIGGVNYAESGNFHLYTLYERDK